MLGKSLHRQPPRRTSLQPERARDWALPLAIAFVAVGFGGERLLGGPKPSAALQIRAEPPALRRSWYRLAISTISAFGRDGIATVAAGVSFYGVLALFPALAAFVSFYGLFGDIDDARKVLDLFTGLVPRETLAFLGDEMARVAAHHHAQLSVAFVIGLSISIWSAKASITSMIVGLNAAYGVRERRGFFALNFIALGLTAGALALAVVIAAVFALGSNDALQVVRWPTLAVLALFVLAVLYRFGPSRSGAGWRWISPGSVIAAIGWVTISAGFSDYVVRFSHYDRTYGPLSAMVGWMIWLWLSVNVVLLGAELNNEAESDFALAPQNGAFE